jgi:predicted PurR-regulated permease PerM
VQLGQWVGLLVLTISLYILWQIRQVLLLVFAAVVLATALNRFARRLQRSGIQRAYALPLIIGILLTLCIGFFWLLVPPFAAQFQQLTELVPRGLERFNGWLDQLRTRVPSQMVPYLPNLDSLTQQLQPLANRLLGSSVAFVSSSLGVLLNVLLVLVITLMLLVNPQPYRKAFIRLFPSFYRRRVDGILDECEVALGGWLSGILFNMSVIAVFSGVGLWILQVPLALANGVLAGLLTFLPNIGPALSVVPPMAIALLDAPWKAVAVLILYIIIQQVESNLLTPYVMAQQVSLLPAVTLLSQVFFATFFGFLGLFLALPLTVVGQVWLREVLLEDVLDQWHSERWYNRYPADAQLGSSETEQLSTTSKTRPKHRSPDKPDSNSTPNDSLKLPPEEASDKD